MRWFVEVSRVGESGLAEKYCVEAKQWQAALQEARKLRGDSGALSKFSIELLDDGYRAVDPALKLRYLVNKAPGDAPLTEESEVSHSSKKSNGKHSLSPSAGPTAFAASVAPASETQAKPTVSNIPRPGSHGPPRPASVAPPRPASNAPPRPASNAPPRPQLVVPDDPVPRAPRAPTGLGLESEPAAPTAAAISPAPARPAPAIASAPAIAPAPAPVVASVPAPGVAAAPVITAPAPAAVVIPAPAPVTAPPPVATAVNVVAAPVPVGVALPAFEVVRERGEEPRADSPITYREVAYAVKPGTSRAEVEALLWARYKEVAGSIEQRATGKFVQLAVFDHVFQKRP
ncbi:MAG TPA: hypothetical protein VGM44_16040, partial [Polyangiaceae bacterium]